MMSIVPSRIDQGSHHIMLSSLRGLACDHEINQLQNTELLMLGLFANRTQSCWRGFMFETPQWPLRLTGLRLPHVCNDFMCSGFQPIFSVSKLLQHGQAPRHPPYHEGGSSRYFPVKAGPATHHRGPNDAKKDCSTLKKKLSWLR